MTFFAELKRRNVFRVGIAYLVVAWLVLQLVSVISPILMLPDWFARAVLVLLAIGFPFALIIAWAFELTPEGIKPTHEVSENESITPQTGRKLNVVIAVSLVLVVILLGLNLTRTGDRSIAEDNVLASTPDETDSIQLAEATDTELEKSVAVLPFANLSDDENQEYFVDGLTEELLNKLARIDDLLVPGRTSTFYFKGSDESLQAIGSALNVNYIVTGSVRKSGDQLRITAQLSQAENGFELWSDTFDRQLEDIFVIQDQMAELITRALSVTISAGDLNQPGMTKNVEAYEEFLSAQGALFAFNRESIMEAIDHIERAVALDPEFSYAWLMMRAIYSSTELLLPDNLRVNHDTRAEEALAKVRALTPTLPELIMGDAADKLQSEQNLAELENLYLEIIRNSGDTDVNALSSYSNFLMRTGQLEAALRYAMQVRRLAPLEPLVSWNLANQYMNLGRNAEALEEINRGLELEGLETLLMGRKYLAEYLVTGDINTSIATLESMGTDPVLITVLTLWSEGNTDEAQALIREAMSDETLSGAIISTLSELAARTGDYQTALDYFQSIQDITLTAWMPLFSDGRQQPEFNQLMEDLGIADYWRQTGNWADNCSLLPDSDTEFECF